MQFDEYNIGEAFEAIEDELIASMMRNMQYHRNWEDDEGFQWEQWQALQLQALEKYRQQNDKKFGKQFGILNGKSEEIIRKARETGQMDQEIEILQAIKAGLHANKDPEGITAAFFRLNDRKLEALINATINDMQKAEYAILRKSADEYRSAIYNAQIYANTVGDYRKAVDMAVKDMLAKGLTCVRYKDGSEHRLGDYADMAIRTAAKRAYLTGEGEKRREWGQHLVIMNKRGADQPCPKCVPWVGLVMIDDVWSGGSRKDGDYPLISEAISQGLYHPRCRDSHTTYFPGITKNNGKYTKPEIKKIEAHNRKEVREQYAERQAEKYERLSASSLAKENKDHFLKQADKWRYMIATKDDFDKYSYENVERTVRSDIITKRRKASNIILQLFAESDLKNQDSRSLVRSMRKFEKRIVEHEGYIASPYEHVPNWDQLSEQAREGLKKHWKKEIRNFRESIQNRVDELKRRGEFDG